MDPSRVLSRPAVNFSPSSALQGRDVTCSSTMIKVSYNKPDTTASPKNYIERLANPYLPRGPIHRISLESSTRYIEPRLPSRPPNPSQPPQCRIIISRPSVKALPPNVPAFASTSSPAASTPIPCPTPTDSRDSSTGAERFNRQSSGKVNNFLIDQGAARCRENRQTSPDITREPRVFVKRTWRGPSTAQKPPDTLSLVDRQLQDKNQGSSSKEASPSCAADEISKNLRKNTRNKPSNPLNGDSESVGSVNSRGESEASADERVSTPRLPWKRHSLRNVLETRAVNSEESQDKITTEKENEHMVVKSSKAKSTVARKGTRTSKRLGEKDITISNEIDNTENLLRTRRSNRQRKDSDTKNDDIEDPNASNRSPSVPREPTWTVKTVSRNPRRGLKIRLSLNRADGEAATDTSGENNLLSDNDQTLDDGEEDESPSANSEESPPKQRQEKKRRGHKKGRGKKKRKHDEKLETNVEIKSPRKRKNHSSKRSTLSISKDEIEISSSREGQNGDGTKMNDLNSNAIDKNAALHVSDLNDESQISEDQTIAPFKRRKTRHTLKQAASNSHGTNEKTSETIPAKKIAQETRTFPSPVAENVTDSKVIPKKRRIYEDKEVLSYSVNEAEATRAVLEIPKKRGRQSTLIDAIVTEGPTDHIPPLIEAKAPGSESVDSKAEQGSVRMVETENIIAPIRVASPPKQRLKALKVGLSKRVSKKPVEKVDAITVVKSTGGINDDRALSEIVAPLLPNADLIRTSAEAPSVYGDIVMEKANEPTTETEAIEVADNTIPLSESTEEIVEDGSMMIDVTTTDIAAECEIICNNEVIIEDGTSCQDVNQELGDSSYAKEKMDRKRHKDKKTKTRKNIREGENSTSIKKDLKRDSFPEHSESPKPKLEVTRECFVLLDKLNMSQVDVKKWKVKETKKIVEKITSPEENEPPVDVLGTASNSSKFLESDVTECNSTSNDPPVSVINDSPPVSIINDPPPVSLELEKSTDEVTDMTENEVMENPENEVIESPCDNVDIPETSDPKVAIEKSPEGEPPPPPLPSPPKEDENKLSSSEHKKRDRSGERSKGDKIRSKEHRHKSSHHRKHSESRHSISSTTSESTSKTSKKSEVEGKTIEEVEKKSLSSKPKSNDVAVKSSKPKGSDEISKPLVKPVTTKEKSSDEKQVLDSEPSESKSKTISNIQPSLVKPKVHTPKLDIESARKSIGSKDPISTPPNSDKKIARIVQCVNMFSGLTKPQIRSQKKEAKTPAKRPQVVVNSLFGPDSALPQQRPSTVTASTSHTCVSNCLFLTFSSDADTATVMIEGGDDARRSPLREDPTLLPGSKRKLSQTQGSGACREKPSINISSPNNGASPDPQENLSEKSDQINLKEINVQTVESDEVVILSQHNNVSSSSSSRPPSKKKKKAKNESMLEINVKKGKGRDGHSKKSRSKDVAVDFKLPDGWRRKVHIRQNGISAGRVEIHIYNPDGTRFRTKPELSKHLEDTKSPYSLSNFFPNDQLFPANQGSSTKKSKKKKSVHKASESASLEQIIKCEPDQDRILPQDWTSEVVYSIREGNCIAHIVVISPIGKKFRRRKTLRNYLKSHDSPHNISEFDFSLTDAMRLELDRLDKAYQSGFFDLGESDDNLKMELSEDSENADDAVPMTNEEALELYQKLAAGENVDSGQPTASAVVSGVGVVTKVGGILLSSTLTTPRAERKSIQLHAKNEKKIEWQNISNEESNTIVQWIENLVSCRSEIPGLDNDAVNSVALATEDFIKRLALYAIKFGGGNSLNYENIADAVASNTALAPLRPLIPQKITFRKYRLLNKPTRFCSFTV